MPAPGEERIPIAQALPGLEVHALEPGDPGLGLCS